jgi:hypothetical protein
VRLGLLQMKVAAAEQSQQTDNDQIDRNDVVQQSRHHKNKNAAHLEVALRLPYRHPLANLPLAVRLRLYAVQRV